MSNIETQESVAPKWPWESIPECPPLVEEQDSAGAFPAEHSSPLKKIKKKKKGKREISRAQDDFIVGINELGGTDRAEIPAAEIEPTPEEPVPEEPAPEEPVPKEPAPEEPAPEEPVPEEPAPEEPAPEEPAPEEPAPEEPAPEEPVPEEPVAEEAVTFEEDLSDYYARLLKKTFRDAVRSTPCEPKSAPEPLCLPFSAQHKLLVYLQQNLEAMCFAFGQKHSPEALQRQGWDCPEAVELQVWTNELLYARCFVDLVPKASKRTRLLNSVATIRDYAVSRTRLDAVELEKVLAAAQEMARLIGEAKDTSATEKLCEEIISTNRWLEEEKDQLKNRLDAKLRVFEAARAKVDLLEETTRAAFDRGLLKRQNAAHMKVLFAIGKAETDQSADIPDRSVAPSSLDWVNGLENSLMLGEESQTESLV
ncbi:hypothetical protein ACHAPU_000707 [Fusarium lateritium]